MVQQHGLSINNLRQVFCGDFSQHEQIVQKANQFLHRDRPGVFVVGGQNLTGKTRLIKEIKARSGLTEYDPFARVSAQLTSYIDQNIEFSDIKDRPRRITPEEVYKTLGSYQYIPRALSEGVRVVFLNEAWAGQKQAFKSG